jgi:NitT/TauT family transport system ATP-binding protein
MPASIDATATSLTLTQLAKTFPGGVEAVAPLDLRIGSGEFVAMIGPSGCGKSTLLRMIAGLESPTSGTMLREQTLRNDIAYVFQDAHLLPWRRVLANVALPLELTGVAKREREAVGREILDQVGLGGFENRYPAQLSGGQRMRVSLARAMVTNPRLLLLDEPFAALDEITRQQLDEWLRNLWCERGITVLFVTHSIAEAAFLADRAIVFTPRPARIVIDHDLGAMLPHRRVAELRGTPVFAEQTRVLYAALQHGEGR